MTTNLFLNRTRWLQTAICTLILLFSLGSGNVWGANKTYTKITSTSSLSSGDKCLIVCEGQTNNSGDIRVFKASAASSGEAAESEYISMSNSSITCNENYAFTLTSANGTDWKITGTNGSIGHISGKNTLGVNTTITNTISFSDGNAVIGCDSRVLRCNANNGSPLFRYYSNTQQAVQLYKEVASSTPSLSISDNATSLAMGDAKVNGSGVSNNTLTFSGSNLTANATLSISGTNAAMFSVSPTSVSKGSGTITNQTFTVTYTPTSAGSHSATLTISSAGATSKTIALSGTGKYEVTWKCAGSDDVTTLVASGSRPTFPSTPTSCDTGEGASTTFVGWTKTTWSGKKDKSYVDGLTTDATKVHTSNSTMSTITANGTVYHAVFCKGSGGSVTITNKMFTDALSASYSTVNIISGDYTFEVNACKQDSKCQMRDNATLSYIAIPTLPGVISRITATTVANGSGGSYSSILHFKHTKSRGNANTNDITKLDCSSSAITSLDWDVSGSNSTYKAGYLLTSGGLRLSDLTIYYGGSGTNYMTNCCTALGTINGSISLTNEGCTPTQLKATWKMSATTGIASQTLKVYKSSDDSEVTGSKITSISASTSNQTQTITGLNPCETYYVKVENVSMGSSYCEGGVIGTSSTATTLGWGVAETLTNTTHVTGESRACPATNYVATYTATTGNVLPSSVSVSIGGVAKTQGTHYTWSVSDGTGTLTILAANITNSTGAISISITSDAAAYQFWYGDKGESWTATAFVSVGNNEHQITNFVMPAYEYEEGLGQMHWNVSGSGISSTNREFYAMTFAQTQSQCGDYQYYNDGDNKNSWIRGPAAGAKGTLRIYDNQADNGQCAFIPNEYVLKFGTSEVLFVEDGSDANVWETAILSLSALNGGSWTGSTTYRVGVGDASHNWVEVYNKCAATAVSSMGYKTASGNNWATGLNNISSARGKFRIWINNCTNGNWECHFVPYYRVTYDGSGADGSTTASTDVSCEGNAAARTVQAAANGFTVPTGKSFGGWASSPENAAAGTVAYAANADVVLTQSIVLYAIWTDIDYTVTVSQSPDVSATTTGQTSSAHYNGTINLTTTVPSGYRFVNWTTSDGFSITNPTSATTASFTMPAKNVTVTANFQQTHTVDWYVGGSASANKIGDDGQTTVVDHGGKISAFPATTPDGTPCDKTFVGWTNTSSYVHGTSPLFNDVAGSPTINADASFYAVFAEVNSVSASLTKMTADDDLEVGDKIVIIAQDTRYGMYQASASSYVSYWTTTDMDGEPSLSEIEADDKKYLDVAAGGVTDTWKLGDATNGYLYNSSSTNLEFSTTNSSNLTLIKWTDDSFTLQAGQYISCRTDLTGANANKWRGAGASCDPENDNNCSGTEYYYLYKYVPGGTTYTGHTINCADCGTSVTPTYTAAPTGGTVSVTKSASPVTSGSTVKTCTAVDLTVTITPASHYTLTGFTATGLTTGTATISPTVGSVLPTTSAQTFTVTVSASATGTLNLTPTFTEDTKVAITWNVNGVNQSIAATEGLTWVYSGEDLTALPSTPSVPAGCTGTKVFAGWSQKHSDATEQDAAWYDDLFDAYNDPTVPTGITSAKTFYAVFATSSSNPLAGEVMWDEPWTGTSDKTAPTSPSSGATVYNSTVLTYAYTDGNTTTQVYAEGTMYSGGAAAPELLISKTSPSGVWTVTNIPTGGSAQTELTLSYKTNRTTIEVTSGTSGITIGDATVDGNTYTHTITISHSPSTINNFSLIFTNTGSANARIDDIHLVVPGSGTMTDYVTLCAPSWTITYNKNTEDAVTNLPSPTSVLQSTGSGTLSSTVPERATYTFTGWAETTSGAVAYAAGGSITGVTGDKTLYAVWVKTPVEELTLNYSELNKYVGDPAVTLEVTGVTPAGADATVTWSSNNSTVASVVAATGVVTFGTVGTATITATSTVTGTTTAYCYVTVRNKPTASFTDLIHDGNGTDLSTYYMQNVAGTAIVFPTLDDYATPGDDCDSKHYIFVGWTTSDNNDDPQDHLVASGELEDDQDKVFYAVWADGVAGVSYTKLANNSFKTSPAKYVIGAIDGDDTFYFYSCAATDANNGNGGCTNAPGTNAPIQFTLSGTADALVATSTEATARYLTPLTAKNFQMSATSKTIQLNDDGTIANPSDESWTLRFNTSEDYLRWYSSATGNAAYFYEVTAGAAVSYRTSCCTNNVLAPTVIATNTAYTVTLTWAAVDGATGYEVSWNGGAFTAATSPCVKSDLTASTDYTYKVRATYDPLVKCGALVASGSVTTDDVYSVTYSGGTGTGSCSPSGSVAPASYEAGATVTLAPTNSFSLTSNTFAAWVVKDADDNDVPVSNNQFTMPAKNVTVTATWTAVEDKYYDRMHDGTDASHGGVADGEGKYYLVLEGCNYTVPTLTDDDDGDTECHTTHFKLLGWIAYSHLKTDGSGEIKPGEESYIFQGGGTKSATGATYYAIWAIMTE